MNIGIVTTWFERGAAYVSRQYMNVLQKTDNVFIYARGGEKFAIGDPNWDLPNVHWGKRSEAKKRFVSDKWIDRRDFSKWIGKNGIEAIIFNEQVDFTPLIWCKEMGVKTIAYIDYYTEFTIPLFDVYDCLICNTMRHAFAFRNHKNAKYIRWGTDVELYKPSQEKHDGIVFFHSAGMAPIRKGTDLLIQAFYNMNNKGGTKLLIHTQVPLSEKIPNAKKEIDELLREGLLEIVEKSVPAPGLYYKGDIYVYPSRLDGVGLTLMEAAASGLAVITTDNPPMNEFVEKSFGKTVDVDYFYSRGDGYYWPMSVASVNSLTEKMQWFVDNKVNIEEMKNEARKYAEHNLDFINNFSVLHQVIKDTKIQPLSEQLKKRILKYDNRGGRYLAKLIIPIYPLIKKFV